MIYLSWLLFVSEVHAIDADGDGVDAESSGGSDCDDNNNMIYPNATELCDQMDNNCNGEIDEGTDRTFWRDADGDDYGNPEDIQKGCSKPQGYVVNSQDCDDDNPTIHPAQIETCDGFDNNCNSDVDEGCAGNEPSYEGVNSNEPDEEERNTSPEQTENEQSENTEEENMPEDNGDGVVEEEASNNLPSFYGVEEDSGCGSGKSLFLLFPFLFAPFRKRRSM